MMSLLRLQISIKLKALDEASLTLNITAKGKGNHDTVTRSFAPKLSVMEGQFVVLGIVMSHSLMGLMRIGQEEKNLELIKPLRGSEVICSCCRPRTIRGKEA